MQRIELAIIGSGLTGLCLSKPLRSCHIPHTLFTSITPGHVEPWSIMGPNALNAVRSMTSLDRSAPHPSLDVLLHELEQCVEFDRHWFSFRYGMADWDLSDGCSVDHGMTFAPLLTEPDPQGVGIRGRGVICTSDAVARLQASQSADVQHRGTVVKLDHETDGVLLVVQCDQGTATVLAQAVITCDAGNGARPPIRGR